jgi:tetratricopeptide (TPR) repeat protein
VRLSRRGKRRFVLVLTVGILLVLSAIGFRTIRSAQQTRLFDTAREAGLEAFARKDLETTIDELSYYLQHDNRDVEVLLAFADARAKVPMANGQHLIDAVGLYKQSLNVLDADSTLPQRAERVDLVLRRLVELYGLLGMRFELKQTAERILTSSPDDVDVLAARAMARIVDRELDTAYADAQRLSELEPDGIRWRQLQLEIMRRRGDDAAQLLDVIEQWMKTRASDGRYHVLKAGLLASVGREAEARQVVAEGAERGANSLPALEMLVDMLDELSLRDVADDVINRVQQQFPQEQWVRQAKAHRRWQAGALEEALREVEAVEQSGKELQTGLRKLEVLLLLSLDRDDESRSALQPLLEPTGDPADDLNVAWARAVEARLDSGAGDWEQGMQRIDHAIALMPLDPALRLLKGEAYVAVGELVPASEAFAAAVKLDPNWITAGLTLAECLLRSGRAEDAFRVAVTTLGRSDRSTLAPFLTYARAYLAVLQRGGNPSLISSLEGLGGDITKVYEDIHRQAPGYPEVESLLVEVYVRSGRIDLATRFLEEAARGPDPRVPVLLALADASARHDLGLERPLLERAQEKAGLTLPIAFALADLEAREGRADDGLSLIDLALSTADPEDAAAVGAQRARVSYLVRMEHPEARAAISRFASDFADSTAAQSFVLGLRPSWEDRALVERAIANLRSQLGDRSERASLAQAQYLLRFGAGDEASLAEATMLLDDLLRRSPDSLAARTLMAEASLLGERPSPSRAVMHLKAAVEVAPGQLGLYPRLISLLQQQGDFGEAGQYLRRLGALAGRDERYRRTEMELLRQQGDYEAALVRASGLFDENAPTDDQLVLASMYRRAGRFDEAAAVYRRLLADGESSSLLLAQAADFYGETGRFERGEHLLLEVDSKQHAAERALLLGAYHDRHGAAESAQRWLQQAVMIDPQSAKARHALARFLLMRGQRPEARAQALAGLQVQPDHEGLRGVLALSYVDGDPAGRAEAISILRDLSEGDDQLLALLEFLEAIPVHEGRLQIDERVLAESRRLLSQPGSLPATWNFAVRLHLQSRRTEEAIELARRAVSRFPAEPAPAQVATDLLTAARRWDEALVEADQWRRRSLHDPLPADVAIAGLLLQQDRAEDAVSQLELHASRLSALATRQPEWLAIWLQALLEIGRDNKAAAIALPLLREEPAWRAKFLLMSADMASAEAAAVALGMVPLDALDPRELPALASAWNGLGMRTGRTEFFERADELAAQAEAASEESAERTNARALRGAIAEARGDIGGAESWYRQVLAEDPEHLITLNNLAFLLANQDRAEEALPLAERAIALRPDQPEILDTYAQALRRVDRLDEAERAILKALSARPDEPAMLLTCAEIQLGKGDRESAERQLRAAMLLLDAMREPPLQERQRAEMLQAELLGRAGGRSGESARAGSENETDDP